MILLSEWDNNFNTDELMKTCENISERLTEQVSPLFVSYNPLNEQTKVLHDMNEILREQLEESTQQTEFWKKESENNKKLLNNSIVFNFAMFIIGLISCCYTIFS